MTYHDAGLAQAILLGCLLLVGIYFVTTYLFRKFAHGSSYSQAIFITLLWVCMSSIAPLEPRVVAQPRSRSRKPRTTNLEQSKQ
eukprot:4701695-Amphidinium_carterae.1